MAALFIAAALALAGCRTSPGKGFAPASTDPLEPQLILRSNADFLRAQAASQNMLTDAFKHFETGVPLTEADKTNLLRGARLCAAMSAYLPGKAGAQDFTCGEALAALGYHQEAIRRYEMFMNFAGENPTEGTTKVVRADAYGLMSVSLTATGKYKEARDAADTALKAFPNTPAYLYDRGLAETNLGDKVAAKKDLEQAAKAPADDPAKRKAETLLKAL